MFEDMEGYDDRGGDTAGGEVLDEVDQGYVRRDGVLADEAEDLDTDDATTVEERPNIIEALKATIDLPTSEALEARQRILEPFFAEPPADQWAILPRVAEDGQVIRVPFTDDELEAIAYAQNAHEELVSIAGRTSGAARDYFMTSQFFPRGVRELLHRPQAVWGLATAATAAHVVSEKHQGTAWEPQREEADAFAVVQALPNSLVAHQHDA